MTTEVRLRVVIVDGHPDQQRLVSSLIDHYAAPLEADVAVQQIAIRDLSFDPNLKGPASSQQVPG